jgi:hypothetical protein
MPPRTKPLRTGEDELSVGITTTRGMLRAASRPRVPFGGQRPDC